MARVEWTRLSGEDIETVIAIMLCRRFPTAVRPQPSRGDGGIDLFVPGSSEGAAIWQIKKFAENLTNSQKNQIKKSWDTFVKYSAEQSLKVVEWNLVSPRNPSNEQRAWLANEVTAGANFPRIWHGLDYVEGLAAEFPDVIDYYLRDGKDRLEAKLKEFLSLISPGATTEPAASQETLINIHKALNSLDPHFRYDFAIDGRTPGQDWPPIPNDTPGLLAAVRSTHGDSRITYKIFARFDDAVKYRPVPGKFTLVAEHGSELQARIEDWAKFGAPLDNVPARDIAVGLPGGFESTMETGFISLRPSGPIADSVAETTIQIVDPDGSVVESLDFTTDEITSGVQRSAVRTTGHDRRAGILGYELRLGSTADEHTIRLTIDVITGKRPADALPALRFATAFRPPHLFQISTLGGPILVPPATIPNEFVDNGELAKEIAACEALVEIQKVIRARIVAPDLTQVTVNQFRSWETGAALLRGEVITGQWDQGAMVHLSSGVEPPAGAGPVPSRYPWTIELAGSTFTIGTVEMRLEAARLDDGHPPEQHDGHWDIWVLPAGTNTWTLRMVSKGSG